MTYHPKPYCDWSRAELWAWLWFLTDRADPKRFMSIRSNSLAFLSLRFDADKETIFGVELGVRERMNDHHSFCAAVLVYQPLLGTAKTCWHTTRLHPPISDARMRICDTLTYAHTQKRSGRGLFRASLNGLRRAWWMGFSLRHMATHRAGAVRLSVAFPVNPNGPTIMTTAALNGWVQTGS